ncbi:hypothetical protein [Hafnia phage Pocis76]|uniref:Phage protein n=1 Tax=Hafnia phage Pocis76 TaxID=2831174 RepID=A0A8E7KY45_9CAUD|nr:hypothetical protein [Hafnia phage Pocis76]
MFDDQIQVKVISRNDELTKGIFKVGTVLDLDLEEMVTYHSGMVWRVKQIGNKHFALSDGETVFEVVG